MNLSSEYSLWLILPCILLGLLYAGILYWRNQRDELSNKLRWFLFTLRTLTVSLIAFLLLGPLVHSNQYTDVKPSIVVAVDGSASIGNVLNSEQQNQLIEDLKQVDKKLSEKFDVKYYTFGSEVTPSLPDSFSMHFTNIGNLFNHIEMQHSNTNLGAMLLVSDGINNIGIDPVYASDIFTAPIISMIVGDTTKHIDVAVSKVTVNNKAFKNNQFPIRVLVTGTMAGGQNTTLRIKQGDKILEEKPIQIRNERFNATHIFYQNADSVGLKRYTIEIDPVSNEHNLNNNSQTVVVEVLDRKQKVLIVAHAPHPDIAVLKSTLANNIAFEVDVEMANKAILSAEKYDIVILHQLPSLKYPMEQMIQKCNDTRTPILFIIGQATNLARFNQLKTGFTIDQQKSLTEDAMPSFNHSFRSFQVENSIIEDCDKWTPLLVPFGEYKFVNSGTVLFYQKIGSITMDYPLIAFNNSLEGRFGFITGEGLWRWSMNASKRLGNNQNVQDLLIKTIQFLSSDEKNKRFRVYCEKQYASYDRIVVKAEVYNEMFEPITTEAVNLVIRNEAGLEYNYLFGIEGANYKIDAGSFPAGTYRWEATTKVDNQNFTESGIFIVSEVNVENEQLTANAALMEKIAVNHNGKAFYWSSESDQVIQYLQDNISSKSIRYTTTGYFELVKLPWFLLIIGFLICLEWFLRKYNGSY